jgi:hypothetical protein
MHFKDISPSKYLKFGQFFVPKTAFLQVKLLFFSSSLTGSCDFFMLQNTAIGTLFWSPIGACVPLW